MTPNDAKEAFRHQISKWPNSYLPNDILLQSTNYEGGLSDGALVTFWYLHAWSRRNGWLFASTSTLAERRNIDSRSMRRHLQALREAGWISREQRKYKGKIRDVWVIANEPPCEGVPKMTPPCEGEEAGFPPCEGEDSNVRAGGHQSPATRTLESAEEKKKEGSKQEQQFAPDGARGTSSKEESPREDSEGQTGEAEGEGGEIAEEDSIHAAALARLRTRSASHVGKKASADTDAPARRTRAREPEWPPTRGSDVYAKWAEEARQAFPGYAPPRPQAQEHGVCKHLLARYADDPDSLLSIIRVALYDWTAIQATIETWYTKGKAVPEPQHILKLAGQLAAKLESGVTSNLHRVSEYRTRFVKGTERDTRPTHRPVKTESPAAIKRREAEEREKRAAAKRKQRAEERWKPRGVERAG